MERLTFVKSSHRWDGGRHPTKYTSRHTFQEVVARLAAYEDTGLEPEEIKGLKAGICLGCSVPELSDEFRHIQDLLQAEKDGRLVVLPPNDPLTLSALEAVRAERQRQDILFGDQSRNSMFEWISILGEEYGELCEAVNETCFKAPHHPDRGGVENIAKEATQVAAVALEIIEAACRRKPEEGEHCNQTI